MYDILVGKQRGLVFPVMCNAHVKIDYSDNVPTGSDINYGIWAHKGSFTFESIVTPYDINGMSLADSATQNLSCTTNASASNKKYIDDFSSTSTLVAGMTISGDGIPAGSKIVEINSNGTSIYIDNDATTDTTASRAFVFGKPAAIASQKVMPSIQGDTTSDNYQSEDYLTQTARLTHEMRIFSSTNFYLSLVNATSSNTNQPAEYKIKAGLKIGGTDYTAITDNAVIVSKAEMNHFCSFDGLSQTTYYGTEELGAETLDGINSKGLQEYIIASSTDAQSPSLPTNEIPVASTAKFQAGQEIFFRRGFNFTSLGIIQTVVDNTRVELVDNIPSNFMGNGSAGIIGNLSIYIKNTQQPIYINDQFHIACSYNDIGKTLNIYLNGILQKSVSVGASSDFTMAAEDLFIGANDNQGVGEDSATANKQFMGELHEMCMTSTIRKKFLINNLLPNLKDTLFYFRFEEVDE